MWSASEIARKIPGVCAKGTRWGWQIVECRLWIFPYCCSAAAFRVYRARPIEKQYLPTFPHIQFLNVACTSGRSLRFSNYLVVGSQSRAVGCFRYSSDMTRSGMKRSGMNAFTKYPVWSLDTSGVTQSCASRQRIEGFCSCLSVIGRDRTRRLLLSCSTTRSLISAGLGWRGRGRGARREYCECKCARWDGTQPRQLRIKDWRGHSAATPGTQSDTEHPHHAGIKFGACAHARYRSSLSLFRYSTPPRFGLVILARKRRHAEGAVTIRIIVPNAASRGHRPSMRLYRWYARAPIAIVRESIRFQDTAMRMTRV